MPQRRVVTEEADGRSRFASDDEPAKLTLIENVLWLDQLWTTSADAPLGQVPDDTTLFAAPGAMLWRIWSIPPPPDEVLQKLSHATLGEEVAAVLRLRPGRTASHAELREFLLGPLAPFKVPAHIWFVEDPLPRSPSGKLLKRELRGQFVSEPATTSGTWPRHRSLGQ